ncbi:uncharacterized protein [Haliotis cracherodii]|uniref:uncharacterized protein n=1 Tax=Haliotis cracherodii TaxID=6455 RepID=UPI0039E82E46
MSGCKVVFAADLSDHSGYAFQWYIDNFHHPDNKVIIATCPEYSVGSGDSSPARIEEMILEVNGKTEQLKAKYLEEMNKYGVTGEVMVLDDNKPGHAICDLVKKMDATYVVTGTRGHGKIRRTILGSVSDYILHHSQAPVLVCRQKGGDKPRPSH